MKIRSPDELVDFTLLENTAEGSLDAAQDLLVALRADDLETIETAIDDLLLNAASALIHLKKLKARRP